MNLTAKEFDLFATVRFNRGKVFSRRKPVGSHLEIRLFWAICARWTCIFAAACGKKIEKNPAQPEFIYTKWGVGYYFTDKD